MRYNTEPILIEETYVSPEMTVLRITLKSVILQGSNTETIEDGGDVPFN